MTLVFTIDHVPLNTKNTFSTKRVKLLIKVLYSKSVDEMHFYNLIPSAMVSTTMSFISKLSIGVFWDSICCPDIAKNSHKCLRKLTSWNHTNNLRNSRFQLQCEIVNSCSWNHAFAKLKWIRKVKIVISKRWNREFLKLKS